MYILYYGHYTLGEYKTLDSAYKAAAEEFSITKRRLNMFVIVDAYNGIKLKFGR